MDPPAATPVRAAAMALVPACTETEATRALVRMGYPLVPTNPDHINAYMMARQFNQRPRQNQVFSIKTNVNIFNCLLIINIRS